MTCFFGQKSSRHLKVGIYCLIHEQTADGSGHRWIESTDLSTVNSPLRLAHIAVAVGQLCPAAAITHIDDTAPTIIIMIVNDNDPKERDNNHLIVN